MNTEIIVKGKVVDDETRCIHYHSPLDIIAIKFKCCDTYYPCYFCHREEAAHPVKIWEKSERELKAVLCGVCSKEMTIQEYFESKKECPFCGSKFNPKCADHYSFYFET